MPSTLAFLADSHATLLTELRETTSEIAARRAVDIRPVQFESILDAVLLETPEDAAVALVESLAAQNALGETAIVILLTIRRTLVRHANAAGAGALDFVEEVFERASIACMRKATEEAERIAKHHTWVFDHLPAMMHSIDAEGKLSHVNERWLEVTGYTREEVVGRRSTEFLTAESSRYAREVVLPNYFKTGRCDNVHYQFVRKDGAIMDIMLSAIA